MKLVLFCDYGLDDAAATVDALAHAAQDGYSEAVLVAAGGNVPPEVSLENAKKLAAHLPFATVPLTVVDTTQEAQPCEFLKTIHGGDGMGDLFTDADGFRSPVAPFAMLWLLIKFKILLYNANCELNESKLDIVPLSFIHSLFI